LIIKVADLTEEVRTVEFAMAAAELNAVLATSPGWGEQRFERDLGVQAEAYRHGSDVYVAGTLAAGVQCTCRRCLDDFEWPLEREFRFLLVKAARGEEPDDDTGLDHYDGEEIDLGRLATEQAVLGLDGTLVCSPDCRGLCSSCGTNLNHETCRCGADGTDGTDG